MGLTDIRRAIVEPTLMADPEVAQADLATTIEEAEELAGVF